MAHSNSDNDLKQVLKRQLELIETSIACAKRQRSVNEQGAEMFDRFFSQYPEAFDYYKDFNMNDIAPVKFTHIANALTDVVKFASYSITNLSEEVERHLRVHSVKDKEYYFGLAEAFVDTLKATLEGAYDENLREQRQWDEELEQCWKDTLAAFKHNLTCAAKEHAL